MILFTNVNISPRLLLPSRPSTHHCVIVNVIRQSQFINQIQILWQLQGLSRLRQYAFGQYALRQYTLRQDLHMGRHLNRSGSARLLYFGWHLLT